MKRFLAARYSRRIPVNMHRMIENALDWEHLPYLHRGTFASAHLVSKTGRSWKIACRLRPRILGLKQIISLRADQKRGIWITRVREGLQKGLTIYSEARPCEGGGITVDVRFFLPKRWVCFRPLAWIYPLTYERLYDEDEAMMVERQKQLDLKLPKHPEEQGTIFLGDLEWIKKRIDDPDGYTFTFKNNKFQLIEYRNRLLAISTVCPHMLAPITKNDVNKGKVICPWHGYEFDITTGYCKKHRLGLKRSPEIHISGNKVCATID